MATSAELALPKGYALNEYRVESTLGVGGFGLTYLATDSNLNLKVAIKEFLPAEFALRCEDQSVKPISDKTAGPFKGFLSRFLEESRTLASFRHPNIVRVMRFFEANQTAYMVMEFVAGMPLSEWLPARRPLSEQAILAFAEPVLDGLEVVHRGRYLHRDIKPSNVFMREDDSPVLIDFGSARVTSANTEITSIVTPGFAPFEQYQSNGNQGPWSDLYALGAVLYWMVTGEKPVESIARVRHDSMPPAVLAADRARYSEPFLKAIDWALAPLEEARPQSVGQFRRVLWRSEPIPELDKPTVLVQSPPSGAEPGAPTSRLPAISVPTAFDPEFLKRIETELATHIGPIAPMVVRSESKKAATVSQLLERASAEIQDAKARSAFVRKFAATDRSAPSGSPTTLAEIHAPSAPASLDAATLARAEAALAQYVGAVARILVKRAATKARNEAALYHLLAEEIEDSDQRRAFVRSGISISGRP